MNSEIFDRNLIRARRNRMAYAATRADFIHRLVSERILERVQDVKRHFAMALELGCGHGLLGQALLASGQVGRLVQCDHAEAPLRDARIRNRTLSLVADEEMLPFAPASFDLITNPFSGALVNDLPGMLLQCRHVLKPDGLLLGALLGGESFRELRECTMLTEQEMLGGMSPRLHPTVELRALGGLLQRAGFALPILDRETITVTYLNLYALITDLRSNAVTNALHQRDRRTPPRAFFPRLAETYQSRYADAANRLPVTIELITFAGWTSHDSQPKPLPRGSGKVHFSEIASGKR